ARESSYIRRDDDDYNIDAEVIGPSDSLVVPSIPTPIEIKHSKMYIIYQRINGISRTFVLTIKIIDSNVFIYVTDVHTEKTVLSHVASVDIVSSNDNLHYLKYIQVSRDFRLISLPENGSINVYNLTKLLSQNILEHIDTIGIILNIDKISGMVRSQLTQTGKNNENIKIGEINIKYNAELELQPYKCVLCENLFIIVCAEFNRYKKVVVVDYTN